MLDHDTAENELAIQDRVLVETDLADHATSFRTVIVRVCESELWLGLASPDHRLESMRPKQPVKLTIARTGAALLGTSGFLRPLGDSKSRIFAVTRPIVLERAQRRGYIRYPIDLPLHFRQLDPATWAPRGRLATTTTKDLSPGGMLFTSDLPLEVGDDLDLTLPFSSWQRLSMSGVVKRVACGASDGEPAEAAVKFTRITSLDQDRIVRLILLTEHRRREAGMAEGRQLSVG
jgi:c-di-GMP-binding flagellar brake protein YcgR